MNSFFKRKNKTTRDHHTRITITGHTQNIEGHAAVVAGSAEVYIVEGMNEWEKDWLNHTVKLTGDLAAPGTEKVIKAAVVMLLSNEPDYDYQDV